MKWLAKLMLILEVGFANHLLGSDEYDKDLARRLVLRSDKEAFSDYELKSLRHFLQESDSLAQEDIQTQTNEDDSGLVKI